MAVQRFLVSLSLLLNCDVHQSRENFLSHSLAKAIIDKSVILFLKSTITRSPDKIKNLLNLRVTLKMPRQDKDLLPNVPIVFLYVLYLNT